MIRSSLTIFTLLVTLAQAASAALPPVHTGIDLLKKRDFDLLQGKRIALVTHKAGCGSGGIETATILRQAPGVELKVLFAPEHGLAADRDTHIGSEPLAETPVISLYGATCTIPDIYLADVDMVVVDLQEVGARFYTYLGTLYQVLAAARQHGLPVVVLDRPNPVGGRRTGGAIPDAGDVRQRLAADTTGCRSLTIIHPLPTRHGMTIGELANLLNSEGDMGVDLTVIPLEGWRRAMHWRETGLPWVYPSPAMSDPVAALLYSGFGPLEATNLSVGRGTRHPFRLIGAPWLNGKKVARSLNRRHLPGLTFKQTTFIPTAPGHPYYQQKCNGIRVSVRSPRKVEPIVAGLHILQTIYLHHPKQYQAGGGFHTMVGDPKAWESLTRKAWKPERLVATWREDLEQFALVRNRYLLYK